MIKIIKTKNYEEMSIEAAKIVLNQVATKDNSILGLATGGTPESMYQIIINAYKDGKVNWENVITFNLDEYIGIPENHPMSYHTYMDQKLFDHMNVMRENIHVPNGNGDPNLNGKNYDKSISDAGGIDLQILGIGENAHIAFNEPGSTDKQGTREVNLTESTINANSRYFSSKDEVPKTAITMGIGSILKAKKIILLASGAKKAQAIFDTINADISPQVPSSYLRNHQDVTLIIDEEAASMLK